MLTFCSASAYATELSDRTLAAIAAFTGAARFALMSDIAARSGSGSPARASSSSRVRRLYSTSLRTVRHLPLRALVDRHRLGRIGVSSRVVGEDVGRDRGVHRCGDVRIDQRHRGPLGERLPGDRLELLAAQAAVFLWLLRHAYPSFSCSDLDVRSRTAERAFEARLASERSFTLAAITASTS